MKILSFPIGLSALVLGLWVLTASCSTVSSSESAPAPADLKTAVFRIEGMTCGGCEAGVKMAVGKLEGVHAVEASYSRSRARISYDPAKVQPETIQAAIEKLGYQASLDPAG